MCELKTKHFKAVCPYTNSEMEISILCQRIHKTQTLNKHYKKMDFSCPKISECTYGSILKAQPRNPRPQADSPMLCCRCRRNSKELCR